MNKLQIQFLIHEKGILKAIFVYVLFLFILIYFSSCTFKKNDFESYVKSAINDKEVGNYERALKYVTKAISLDSNKSFAFVLRGQIESSLERDNLALESFSKAVLINPKNTSAYFYKALSFSLINREDSAINYYNQALSTKQKQGEIYFEEVENKGLPLEEQIDIPIYKIKYFRGLSFFNLGLFSDAIEDFKYSLFNNYNNSHSCFYIGVSFARIGKKQMACSYLERARSMGNTDASKVILDYCNSKSDTVKNNN